MNERIANSDYQQLHHFISESPWAYHPVIARVGLEMSELYENRSELVGLIIDESGHRKSGKKSVGVARQYLGSVGKVDNGQVAVFASLNQGNDVGMVNTKLYLPKVWTKDQRRCQEAGIPKESQIYKTKPELALEMIIEMQNNVEYAWVGGDSLYGNSKKLRLGLQELQELFVMDVSEDLYVYLEDPKVYVPQSQPGKGRRNSNYVSDCTSLKVKTIKEQLTDFQWKTHNIRKGTKGALIRKVVVLEVYVWSTRRPAKLNVEKLRLIISCNEDGSEVKYSLTNDIALEKKQRLSDWGVLYRQMQRYWVERGIQNCKDSLGMTDYQVRGWMAWHHHIALTMMALHYMVEQKIIHENEIPLLSCPDIKFFLALNLPRKTNTPEEVWNLIQKRHKQRQKDLNRYEI